MMTHAKHRIPNDRLAAFLVLVAAPACSHVEYVKVPTPTQYSKWDDEDQRRADAMEGVRYYLPRPFVHLKRTIPVSQRVAFISFTYKDGSYLVEFPEDTPSWVARVAPKKLSITQALAASLASTAGQPKNNEGGLQSGRPQEDGGAASKPSATERPPTELTSRTGFINDTDPVTHLSSLMDVVYLPDFEEQYIIQPHGLLGKADIEARLRNGWAAEVFAQQYDNSNLIPYVIKQVENASEAASGIAASWFPATAPAKVGLDQVKKAARDSQGFQSGTPLSETDIEKLLGNVIIFKIAEVKFAQPGLYPILKPREVRQWLKGKNVITNEDADGTFEAFIADSMAPWIRPDMAFIPCPPFTMVGFNATTDVFLLPATERVALEAAAESQPASTAKSNVEATNSSLAAIVGKLRNAFNEFPQKDKTTAGAIADGKATDAATTRIEIVASPGQSFATQKADLPNITTRASAALKAAADETTTTAEGATKLIITIAVDPSALAKRQ